MASGKEKTTSAKRELDDAAKRRAFEHRARSDVGASPTGTPALVRDLWPIGRTPLDTGRRILLRLCQLMTDEHAAMKEFLSDHWAGDAAVAYRRAASGQVQVRADLAILIVDMNDYEASDILRRVEPARTRVVSDMAFGVETVESLRAVLEKLGREDLDVVLTCLEKPISQGEIHVVVRTDGRWFIRRRSIASILHPATRTT